MSQIIFLCIFILTALHLNALAYPKKVKIYYENGAGETYWATADVSQEKTVPIPVNGESAVGMNIYKLTFMGPDGRTRSAYTTDALVEAYEKIKSYQDNHPGELLRIPRTTGGFSPGKIETPYLKVVYAQSGRTRIVTDVGANVSFDDFARHGGSSKGTPSMSFTGEFVSSPYTKRLLLSGWTNGTPKLGGSDGKYTFPDLSKVDLKQQRFLLDFGKHPYDRNKQLLYPVYVDHYEGDDAVIIAPHEVQKLERAKKGEKVKVSYWVVPKSYLRVAPDTPAGDALLQKARLQFVEDERQVAERNAPIETIIRANRHNPNTIVEVTVGNDLNESIISFRAGVSGKQSSSSGVSSDKDCNGAYDAGSN